MWISQKNENSKRQKSRESPQTSRTQESHCLAFPKSARILSRNHYQELTRSGNRSSGKRVNMDWRLGKVSCPKLGITVTRRFGKAHLRNRFKRVVREAFRLSSLRLPSNLEIHVVPRFGATGLTPTRVIEDFDQLMEKISYAQSAAKESH